MARVRNGMLLRGVPGSPSNGLQIGRALPTSFDVNHRLIQIPAETPVKISNRHGGRAAGARRTVEVHRMIRREKLIQRTNALGEFLSQVNGIEIPHRNTQELNTGGPVASFERFPI